MINVYKTTLEKYKSYLYALTLTYEEDIEIVRKKGPSLMTKWLDSLPNDYPIIIAKKDNEILGWGIIGSPGFINKTNGIAGIYIDQQYRGNGFAKQIGIKLFQLAKDQGFKRIEVSFRSPSATKLYKSVAKNIGCKRSPFTPYKFYWKDWKVVVL